MRASVARAAVSARGRAFASRLPDAERGRFALWLTPCLMAGVLAYFSLRAEPPGWIGPGLMASSCFGFVLLRHHLLPRAGLAAVLAGAVGFAAGQYATGRAPPPEALPPGVIAVDATIRGVDRLPVGQRVLLGDVVPEGGLPVLRRLIRVRLRDGDPVRPAVGERIRLRVMLRPPQPPAFPGGWDLQRDAFFAGLAGSGWAVGDAEILRAVPEASLAFWWQRVREAVNARFIQGLPVPEGAIAGTLFTGLGSAIPPADRAAFRDSGLAHLLAVAGLHIGIVMGLVFGMARGALALWEWAALHWPCKQIAAIASLLAGLFYLLLTGAHVPIQRAFAMAAIVVLAVVAGRRAISLRGLCLAAAALLILSPEALLGVSFQMSFAAVLALIAGHEALRPHLLRLPRAMRFVAASAATSLLAGAASWPFAAYHFGQVQLYVVLANLAAVPVTALLVMPAGLVALAMMPTGLEQWALLPMGWGIAAILWIGREVSALPDATLAWRWMPGWGLILVGLGVAWLGLWRSAWRLAGVPLLILGVLSPALVAKPDLLISADGRLVGLRTAEGMALSSAAGADGFVLDEWRQNWAGHLVTGLPPVGAGEGFACTTARCQLQASGGTALLLRQPGPASAAAPCADDAVIIGVSIKKEGCTIPLVDRAFTRRHGAVAIWLHGGHAVLRDDQTARGRRPWVILPDAMRPALPDLPMATAEPLPKF